MFSEEDCEKISEDFPLLKDKIYLDNAGACLYSKSQMKEIFSDYGTNLYCNPHSHPDAANKIREIRQRVLRFMNTNENEYSVIFTSGATQSIKLVTEYFPWTTSSKYVFIDECHTSVCGAREIVIEKGAEFQCIRRENVVEYFQNSTDIAPSLFAYPAMSNFCGSKFPLEWTKSVTENPNWYVLLDAASYVSTNTLSLSECRPDFVCLSFYKIFGYPTGLGALIVKNTAQNILRKKYFGGGTVAMNLVDKNIHEPKSNFEEYFEDGTISYLSIIALKYGFDVLNRLPGQMKGISSHTFSLAKKLHDDLKTLKYPNGDPLIEIYSSNDFLASSQQGAIVNFNLKDTNGDVIGFSEFQKVAHLHNIIVRVGCFCNIGACQRYLGLTNETLVANYAAGHVCGDNVDVIGGKPTGSIRISFGYYSKMSDVNKVISVLKNHFLSAGTKNGNDIPNGFASFPRISDIYVYPIKSCSPMRVKSWPVNESGLLFDRNWMIMQGKHILTQKREHLLCLIKPNIDLRCQTLTLYFDGVSSVTIPVIRSEDIAGKEVKLCNDKVCGDEIIGFDCGDEVALWLEDILGKTGVRLVQQHKRKSKEDKEQKLSLANSAQFLLLNQSSVKHLITKMDLIELEREGISDIERWATEQFRGNIVIEGLKPFEEDHWKSISFNGTFLNIDGPCQRCRMISINQNTSETVKEPLKALCMMKERKFCFGVLGTLMHKSENQISVMDDVLISNQSN